MSFGFATSVPSGITQHFIDEVTQLAVGLALWQ
jgi:hypothetical protein